MQWFYNLKIMSKLLCGFLLVALVGVAVGYVGITEIRGIDDSDTMLYEKMTVPLGDLQGMTESFQRARVNLLELTFAETPERRAGLKQEIADRRSVVAKSSEEFSKTIISPAVRDEYNKYLQSYQVYSQIADQVISMTDVGNPIGARDLLESEGNRTRNLPRRFRTISKNESRGC
jgi:methyl-accepting chemotaxis protein